MAEIKDLSTTDANNTGTAANAGFPENMAYSDVNNAARALEGMIARLYADTNGTVTTTGSSNAYLLTPNQTVAAYAAGDRYVFKASFTNTGAVTINVSSLGAKSIVKPSGDALASGEIASGGLYEVIYDGTNFQMQGADDPENLTLTSLTVTGTTALNGNTTIGDAATDTVTITADVASDLIPSADGTHDLGAVGSEWQDLFIDGTANIDSLVADTADIDGGTVDGVVIGGASAAAGTFTTLVANTSLNIAGDGATVTGIKDEDNMASDSATKLATQQSIKAYVDSQVTAQDLDVISDSGNISVDLDSQSLTLTGGSGLDTSATGQTVTIAIDSTVATLTGSQTLTNKTLTAPVISTISNTGTITLPTATDTLVGRDTSDTLTNKTLTSAVLNTGVSGTAVLDEDDMSSNSSTQIATQQSIKAYVDSQVTAQDLDVTDGSSSIDIDLDSESLGILGGTGIDSTASGTGVTLAIDATVATLTGSQTLTNKTLTSAVLNTGVSGTAILDEDNMASDSATQLATQQSIKAYVDSQVTAQDLDVTDGSSSIDIDLDSESLGILGGTGIDSTASGTGVTLAIDSTVATLTGSQTLTNKSLTAPTLTGTAVVASLDISGDIDVDGTTNLDVVDIDSTLTVNGDTALTGGSSGSTVLTLTSNALADTPLMVFQRTGGAVAGKLAYEDTNTAMSFGTTSAHELKLLTNNISRVEITSDGNAGIGGSPVANTPLTLQGPSGYTDTLWLKSVGTNIDSRINIAPTGTGVAQINNSTGTAIAFQISGSEAMRISGGNVAIGTSSPSALAHIYNGTLQVGSKTGDTSIQQNANAIRIAAIPNSSTEWGGVQWYREFSDVIGAEIIAARASSTETDTDLIFKTSTNSSNAVEAMRIDHTANVGVGANNPNERIHVHKSATPRILLTDGTTGTTAGSDGAFIGLSGSQDLNLWNYENTSIRFAVNNSEAARIDSSGNVLAGTTNANPTSSSVNDAGVELSNTGGVRSTVASNPAATFNRKTDDGNIVLFRKDGSTVGTIATEGGDMAIGNDDAGIQFVNGTEHFRPFSMASNAATDALMDVGSSSKRFKNLYLSGGVVFGDAGGSGTPSSNSLDSYEEGIFTPVIQGASTAGVFSYTLQQGSYTKVGRLVSVFVTIYVNNTTTSAVGDLTITGLPFTAQNTNNAQYAGSVGWVQYVGFSAQIGFYVGGASTSMLLRNLTNGGSGTIPTGNDLGNAFYIIASSQYHV